MAQPWYTFPRVDNYGSPDPFGGFPKPDSNIQVPDNYPITALLPGTVSGINSPGGAIPDWGAVVTIKLDSPVNPIATHTAYLHLASVAPGLQVGSHVSAGELVGYNGGRVAAGSQKVPLGFALTSGDYYGYGAGWLPGNPALNPVSLLDSAKAGKISIPAFNGSAASLFTMIPNIPAILAGAVTVPVFIGGALIAGVIGLVLFFLIKGIK